MVKSNLYNRFRHIRGAERDSPIIWRAAKVERSESVTVGLHQPSPDTCRLDVCVVAGQGAAGSRYRSEIRIAALVFCHEISDACSTLGQQDVNSGGRKRNGKLMYLLRLLLERRSGAVGVSSNHAVCLY